ncbi:hypothetical protein AC579_601 [Pseudocercospora musae]|uniref:Uncharacterized protein n=1 Tax=Pseudocercospora musae TaxID=113226 RepID=A0A139ICL1_9PEZI|nr:hypothetical protein AC579_601 [Pseudocercospora musae]
MAAKNPGVPARTNATSMNAPPAGESQAVCHFLDKVAAEIRVLIYEHVFGTSDYARFSSTPVKQSTSASDPDSTEEAVSTMINTSILATSKRIREEALDAFYNTKIVRLDFTQLRNLLDSRASRQPSQEIQSGPTLEETLLLPRIKTLSILSDCLTGPEQRHVNVREEAHRLGLGTVTCCDVGRYRINDQPEHVHFVNSKLVRMWPSVASMPDDFDALDVATSIHSAIRISASSQNLVAWASHTSFRPWVGLHELITTPGTEEEDPSPNDFNSPAHNEYMFRMTDRGGFFRCIVSDPPRVGHVSNSPDQDVPLHKLGPQHDPARLEQASEMLAMNIGRCNWATYDENYWPIPKEIKPSWVELGDSNVLDVQQEKQRELRAAWREYNLTNWPTDPTRTFYVSDVREELRSCPIFPRIFGEEAITKADKRELQQLWYLTLAVYAQLEEGPDEEVRDVEQANGGEEGGDQEDQKSNEGVESGDGHEKTTETPEVIEDEESDEIVDGDEAAMHEWSAELMRKYLSSVERIDKADLAAVSEINMRKAFAMTLTVASELAEPPSTENPVLEATGPSSSDTQSSAERLENTVEQAVIERQSGNEVAGEPVSDSATSIDEDVYQPFLDSYAAVLAYMFKSTVTGSLDALDLGEA